MKPDTPAPAVPAPEDLARHAGLVYVSDSRPGITRHKAGKGFFYKDARGARVTEAEALARIRALAIPPAYTDVWVCARANGHIQATGRDAKGRKQYRYHTQWQQVAGATKYGRMFAFARALPGLRAQVDQDMARRGLPREKVVATVVHLLEQTLIRVGNTEYARSNRSYGLTTLRNRHVAVAEGSGTVRFAFTGKSGKEWQLQMKDRRVARIVKSCQELPGQQLFQYLDEDGERRGVTSDDVNAYLREATGEDFSAKDVRTWAGTVLAALALKEMEAFDSATAAKRNVRAAIERVAKKLGNTPTVCRACYIHPDVLETYADGTLHDSAWLKQAEQTASRLLKTELNGLEAEEALVLVMLEKRLEKAA